MKVDIMARKVVNRKYLPVMLFTIGFAIVASIVLYKVYASTATTGVEPEAGTKSGAVTIANDATASGGKALKFGAAAVAGDKVIAAAGDISTSTLTGPPKQTADAILALNPDGVLVLGDSQYNDGFAAQYSSYFDKLWGQFKSKIHPAPGHHDYYTDSTAAGYYGYYGAAANNASQPNCTASCEGYYSFNLGNWHLIALNTNHYTTTPLQVCAYVPCNATSAQVTWLKADLAANTKPCVLAYWSDPRFASGTKHGSNPVIGPIWDALYAGHVDIALNGHEHEYERFGKQNPSAVADNAGIREFIVGTGGNGLYPFGTPVANSEVRNNVTHGVLKLTLHADSYDWNFLPVDGTFTDSGTTTCNK